jgi:hypothetical protein
MICSISKIDKVSIPHRYDTNELTFGHCRQCRSVSIPHRYDTNTVVSMINIYMMLVSIPHRYDTNRPGGWRPEGGIRVSIPHRYDTNANKIIKDVAFRVEFQSLIGTIQTSSESTVKATGAGVSIPHRYDTNPKSAVISSFFILCYLQNNTVKKFCQSRSPVIAVGAK